MLRISLPEREFYDEETGTFIHVDATTLELEHSLAAVSKWESKWHKPFLNTDVKSDVELVDYVRCMTLTPNVNQLAFQAIPPEVYQQINAYVEDSMTATRFSEPPGGHMHREIITSEIIYYWMIACQIPFSCENWNLNRLLTLIRVCDHKNAPPKKLPKSEQYSRNRALNEARKRQLRTRG